MRIVIVALLLLAACGSSVTQERILHLRGYDIKESDYRAYISPIVQSGLGKMICESAASKTEDERAQSLVHPASGIWPIVPAGGTVQPSRDAVFEDALRAVQITSDECASRH